MSSSGYSSLAVSDPCGAFEALGTLIHFLEAKGALGATPGHHERVRRLSLAIADRLELPPGECLRLELAASFHDLGLSALPESLLIHPRRLTAEEYDQVKRHPESGVAVLRAVIGDQGVIEAVLYHHEYFGGGGYPSGRAGEDIPLLARILAVPEVFDSMIDARPWRSAMGVGQARALMAEHSGSLFDPRVVEAFLALEERTVLDCLASRGRT
jgi:HD-GYP domain-containing protein (c-di-GMP phosphodiesterase class II)